MDDDWWGRLPQWVHRLRMGHLRRGDQALQARHRAEQRSGGHDRNPWTHGSRATWRGAPHRWSDVNRFVVLRISYPPFTLRTSNQLHFCSSVDLIVRAPSSIVISV